MKESAKGMWEQFTFTLQLEWSKLLTQIRFISLRCKQSKSEVFVSDLVHFYMWSWVCFISDVWLCDLCQNAQIRIHVVFLTRLSSSFSVGSSQPVKINMDESDNRDGVSGDTTTFHICKKEASAQVKLEGTYYNRQFLREPIWPSHKWSNCYYYSSDSPHISVQCVHAWQFRRWVVADPCNWQTWTINTTRSDQAEEVNEALKMCDVNAALEAKNKTVLLFL